MSEREQLRATFDEVADLYDRARPLYPRELFDDLLAETQLGRGARVLEIGPGTGQATRALAERGLEVTAVEIGERLASVAKRKLRAFPNVEVVSADVERWEPAARYDLVAAFTSFHWLDPATAYKTAHRLLGADGVLAIVATHHVLREDGDRFSREVQEDYASIGEPDAPPPNPAAVEDLRAAIDASGRFRTTAVRRYLWSITYDTASYIDVLDTYSGHRALPEPTRRQLYDRIRARIDARPGRVVTKDYLATLNVARRL